MLLHILLDLVTKHSQSHYNQLLDSKRLSFVGVILIVSTTMGIIFFLIPTSV